jgi:hypothetical protein
MNLANVKAMGEADALLTQAAAQHGPASGMLRESSAQPHHENVTGKYINVQLILESIHAEIGLALNVLKL